MSKLKEEIIKAEILNKIKELKYHTAIVECALFRKSEDERLWHIYVLKITLATRSDQSHMQRLIEKDRFVLFRTFWSLEMLEKFLSALINVRKVFEENLQRYPEEGIAFNIGGYEARICGNYPREEVQFVGSDFSKQYYHIHTENPFYIVDYAFYIADCAVIYTRPPNLENDDASFSNPAQAVNYYFNLYFETNNNDFQNRWAGIILPIDGVKIKNCIVSGKSIEIEIERDGSFLEPNSLDLNVICTGKNREIFPKRVGIENKTRFEVPFHPSVVEIKLSKSDTKLDQWKWIENRQSPGEPNLLDQLSLPEIVSISNMEKTEAPVGMMSPQENLREVEQRFEKARKEYEFWTTPGKCQPGSDQWTSVRERYQLAKDDLERAMKKSADFGKTDLEEQLMMDVLLPIYNRKKFEGDCQKYFSEASRQKSFLALVVIDIDHFKAVNDNFGHTVGDQVLQIVAKQIKEIVGSRGNVYRYGGEEFVVLLPNYTVMEVQPFAERLRREIESLHVVEIGRKVTISAGVSAYPELVEKPERLFETADKAVYSAKDTGRNRVVLHQP